MAAPHSDHPAIDIGTISNTYGGLRVRVHNGTAEWCIADYDGDNIWEPITWTLYRALIAFQHSAPDGIPSASS